jgi:hypothetical protein
MESAWGGGSLVGLQFGGLARIICNPDSQPYFIAWMQSVSLVRRTMRSTDLFAVSAAFPRLSS